MSWLLPSRVYPASGTFLCLILCQWGGAGERKAGREHSQDRWLELARGIFHTIKCHSQNINWGFILPVTQKGLTGPRGRVWHWLACGEQLYCASLIFFFLPSLLSLFTIIFIIYFVSVTKLFLFQVEFSIVLISSQVVLLILLPITPGRVGGRKRLPDPSLPAGVKAGHTSDFEQPLNKLTMDKIGVKYSRRDLCCIPLHVRCMRRCDLSSHHRNTSAPFRFTY